VDWKLDMAPGSIEGLQEFPWGRFVFFSDPDGNAWSVQGPSAESSAAV
jgi:hypothetical protein